MGMLPRKPHFFEPEEMRLLGLLPANPEPVNRRLFGEVDHDEINAFLQNELRAIEESQRARWEFDFVRGEPLAGAKNIHWEVLSQELVPEVYGSSAFDTAEGTTGNVRRRVGGAAARRSGAKLAKKRGLGKRTRKNKQMKMNDYLKAKKLKRSNKKKIAVKPVIGGDHVEKNE